ncbi:MAG: DUF814 domain-containing protein, partial [Thermoplasmata archaeon]|nr:DUF814 domain-containing protein [Thermoplasmata archaeon]
KQVREKAGGAREALKETERLLASLSEEEERREKDVKRKTFWFERYRWFFTSSGRLVIAGRDAETNDRVVKRHMKAEDRYAHADIHGAPSVVMKAEGFEMDEVSLAEACHFSAMHSKAWSAKIGSADAYWVKPDQVSKTPNPGEFLARGAFVIRGKRHHFHRLAMRAAVCRVKYQGVEMVMCCPPARAENEKAYVIIEPGEEEKSKTARVIANLFNIKVDEAMKILPPGKTRIVETKGL